MYAGTLLDIAMVHSDSLIEQARNGDDKAVSKLVSLWHKRIYNFCYKYFSDHDKAMDMAQRTFISMYNSIGKLKDIKSFKSWLYRIALNHCHEEDRREKRHMVVSYRNDEESEEVVVNIRDAEPDPQKKLQIAELNEILMAALMEIPGEQREVLIMKEYEGLKFREIAEVLDISENTAKSRLYYGLSAVKKILKQRNINKTAYYEG